MSYAIIGLGKIGTAIAQAFARQGKGAPPSVKRARNGSPQTLESGFDPLLPVTNGGFGYCASSAGVPVSAPLPTPPVRNEHKLAVGHFVSAARITDSDLSMLYARVSTPALSTRPDFPLPAGRGGQVAKYKSTTR